MDALAWALVLLIHTSGLTAQAEFSASVPASPGTSLNEAVDLFVTPKITDPKNALVSDLARLPLLPQHDGRSGPDRGASNASLPTSTPASSEHHAVRTDVTRTSSESVPSTTQDFTASVLPPRSTTTTPGSSLPVRSTSEEHPNSSLSTTSKTNPAVSLIPPSPPSSTLKDLITPSASLEKENQAGPSELDVGDNDLDRVPSPSPLDPLLAGLISIFIISTALLSIMLFLKLRQQDGRPEFHRLQDLPMDDLLEDTPLARHSY